MNRLDSETFGPCFWFVGVWSGLRSSPWSLLVLFELLPNEVELNSLL